ncbi:aminotransferase class I/II-fold pyridoxal phosphate-dependent enzyme [Streptomyces sp. NPDC040750]|uniref:trans-sulfuration enzyme family protein n=1 Tax=Streptomyces sp. NPDC040750 TaxID=3154491 RepID=UPI0033C06ADB
MTATEPRQSPLTSAVHLPDPPTVAQPPLAPALYRSTGYAFASTEESVAIRTGARPGYVYSRVDNPTADALSEAVAMLEGAGVDQEVHGQSFGSGMAGITATFMALTQAGAHVVAPRELYGGTHSLLERVLSRFGVSSDFVDTSDASAVHTALRPETRVVFAETLSNPTMTVADLRMLADAAHGVGALLVVDSTFATPFVCRPLEHGADLVLHSATKYIGGHSDATGGVAVGRPDLIERLRIIRHTTGAVLAPDEAYLLRRGLATLPLRMARHCASALTVATALQEHRGVERIDYPGLPSHRSHELARRYLADPAGEPCYGGVATLHVRGGEAAGRALVDRLRLITGASSLGGPHTVAQHVASTTHRQLSPEQLTAAGIAPGAVRLSIGLEDPHDLVADLRRALDGLSR